MCYVCIVHVCNVYWTSVHPRVSSITCVASVANQSPPFYQVKSAVIRWWIPVAIAAGIFIIVIILLMVILYRKKYRSEDKRYGKSRSVSNDGDENSALTNRDSFQFQKTDNAVASRRPLHSPACPGVTVTLLHSNSVPDATESLLPSVFDREEDTPSFVPSTYEPASYRDGHQSTLYSPSTVYRYDDVGSIDFPDSDMYYPGPQGHRNADHRLYHAKSDKFIDPDVLALYSSDESIPSMLDEKYAVSRAGVNTMAGSVPSGLHRSAGRADAIQDGISASRSTASLSKMAYAPELSLPPGAGLESNQYWI